MRGHKKGGLSRPKSALSVAKSAKAIAPGMATMGAANLSPAPAPIRAPAPKPAPNMLGGPSGPKKKTGPSFGGPKGF